MNPSGDVRRRGPSREEGDGDEDPLGFDETRGYFSATMRRLVPQNLAVSALTVGVTIQEGSYTTGDKIPFEVVFRNHLPVPVEIESPTSKLWYWSIDGESFASDETPYVRDEPNSMALRARETKVVPQTWNGRFRREGDPVRWIPAEPGTYTVEAVFETAVGKNPTGAATVRIER